MSAKFEMKLANNGKHYFNLLANNGEVILTSQMYASQSGALKGIASVRANAGNELRYECRHGKHDKVHFVLKAANNRVIGTSQVYIAKSAIDTGILSVMRNAQDAELSM